MNDLAAIAAIAAAIATIVSIITARAAASRAEFEKVKLRVANLEEKGEHLPGWAAMTEIRDRLAAMEGDLKGIRATMEAHIAQEDRLRNKIDTIESYLLTRGAN